MLHPFSDVWTYRHIQKSPLESFQFTTHLHFQKYFTSCLLFCWLWFSYLCKLSLNSVFTNFQYLGHLTITISSIEPSVQALQLLLSYHLTPQPSLGEVPAGLPPSPFKEVQHSWWKVEHKSYPQQLRELEERRIRGHLISLYNHLKRRL